VVPPAVELFRAYADNDPEGCAAALNALIAGQTTAPDVKLTENEAFVRLLVSLRDLADEEGRDEDAWKVFGLFFAGLLVTLAARRARCSSGSVRPSLDLPSPSRPLRSWRAVSRGL
jgi:hypothetical protein